MANNIKTFLGKSPSRIIENIHMFSAQETEVFNQTIVDVSHNDSCPELGIRALSTFSVGFPIVEMGKGDYYVPIKCGFEMNMFDPKTRKIRSGTYYPPNVFYINGLGARPSFKRLIKHFKSLLSSEYGGKIDTVLPGSMGNRYSVHLSNAKTPFLYTLLHQAVVGNCAVIDYSWIAPLQNLIEEVEDREKLKRAKNRLTYEEDEVPPPTPHRFEWGPPNRPLEQTVKAQSRAELEAGLITVRKRFNKSVINIPGQYGTPGQHGTNDLPYGPNDLP